MAMKLNLSQSIQPEVAECIKAFNCSRFGFRRLQEVFPETKLGIGPTNSVMAFIMSFDPKDPFSQVITKNPKLQMRKIIEKLVKDLSVV
jgi:hypothetical protein